MDRLSCYICFSQVSIHMRLTIDGAHRWRAYKKTGQSVIPAIVKTLNKIDPLLYAAKLAIGPKQLTEAETRQTARKAFKNNSKLRSSEIGKAIGRSRQAVDAYIADLRATSILELDLKIFCLSRLGIPQDRIAKRLGLAVSLHNWWRTLYIFFQNRTI